MPFIPMELRRHSLSFLFFLLNLFIKQRMPMNAQLQSLSRMLPLATTLLFFASLLPLRAQPVDNRGREFWVTFMPNLGSQGASEASDMRLYLSSDRVTSVTITYTGTGVSRTVPLAMPNVLVEVNINMMFGDFVELDDVFGTANEISAKSFHILAEDEITLYGANIRSKSADAFLGLPQDVLTGRYIVLAYPNGFSGIASSGNYDTPSQFAVIATEDGTSIRITPQNGLIINRRPSAPFTVNLDRGEVYFGQADVFSDQEQDVSGTEILATKPVAVFGGNKRTSIPTRVGNYRDYLVEQLPPVNLWGKEVLLAPHAIVAPTPDTAVVRVLSANPGTIVKITNANGEMTYQLGAGVSLELPLIEPMSITATEPILVAQYEHSAATDDASDMGDPFMMLATPSEQFQREYTIGSISHPEFQKHFINIIAPGDAIGSLRIDGQPVTAEFKPMPGSNYRYAQISVNSGSHHITADSPFGLYAYGYGQSTSYGYPGGFDFSGITGSVQAPFPPSTILLSSSPNPVSGSSAMLDLVLTNRERVSIELIDIAGRSVRVIVEDAAMEAGAHRIDADLSGLPGGEYFYRVTTQRGEMGVEKVVVGR
jgi:hypothetical protein